MITKFILDLKNKLKDTSGSAIMSVMIVFSVLLILITSGSILALNNFKKSDQAKNNHSSYYLAEAGINEFTEKMVLYLESLSKSEQEIYSKLTSKEIAIKIQENVELSSPNPDIMGEKSKRRMLLEEIGEDEYKLISIAEVDGESRSLQQTFSGILKSFERKHSEADLLGKYGLVIRNSFDLTGTKFQGNVFFGNPMDANFSKEDAKITGSVELLPYPHLPYPENESFFHTTSLDDPGFIYKNKFTKGGGNPMITADKIKNNQEMLEDLTVDFPWAPSKDESVKIDHKNIKVLKVIDSKSYKLDKGSLIWEGGRGLLDLSDPNSPENYFFPKLNIQNLYSDPHYSILYIDVGDKDVHIIADEFDVKGGLLVLGEGSLTIHAAKQISENNWSDDFNFTPLMFSGISNQIHKNDQVQEYKTKNNLVLVAKIKEGGKLSAITSNIPKNEFNASLVAKIIDFTSDWGHDKSNVNIFSLKSTYDKNQKVRILGTFRHGNLSLEDRKMLVYMPYGEMYINQAVVSGFFYVNRLFEPDTGSLMRHDWDLVKSLPPSVKELTDGLNLHGNVGDGNAGSGDLEGVDTDSIQFGSIREIN